MRRRDISVLLALILGVFAAAPLRCESEAGPGAPPPRQSNSGSLWEADPSSWKIAIYPIYGWLPVFGANVTLPALPELPGGGIAGPNASTVSGSFNGAGFAGLEIEKSRVVGSAAFLYAAVSGDNSNPKAHMGLDVIFGQANVGYQLVRSLSLEGGVRRMSVKISASVGERPEVSRKPGVWDPVIGMTWTQVMGRKWRLRAHFDGGGFGVGSDVTLSGTARVDYRFAKHFGVAMGISALHFQITDTVADQTQFKRTLTARQTLYGPLFGFGIYF